jgi:D-alanyl-D-alanine dipeptidase
MRLLGLIPCSVVPLLSQTVPSAIAPKPPDAPAEWKPLLGSFTGDDKVIFEILENNGRLELKQGAKPSVPLRKDSDDHFSAPAGDHAQVRLQFVRGAGQAVKELIVGDVHLQRRYGDTEMSQSFRVTPVRPLEELRKEALLASPPQEARIFRKPDLVELVTLDPSIHLDIRYATTNNFLGTPVYTQPRAFLQRPAALATVRALQVLKPYGYGFLVHDGYRPWYVTKIFWEATPPEGKIFVADPVLGSRHNRGCAVDLTLYDLKTGAPVEMPGTYDEMSPRSFPDYPGGTSLQRWRRDLLRYAMESEGFTVYENEWWHFDYKDWQEYSILNISFEQLNVSSAVTATAKEMQLQSAATLIERIHRVTTPPEFVHADFGIEFYSLDTGKIVFVG